MDQYITHTHDLAPRQFSPNDHGLCYASYINLLSLFTLSTAQGRSVPSSTKSTSQLSKSSRSTFIPAIFSRPIGCWRSYCTRMSTSLHGLCSPREYEPKSHTPLLSYIFFPALLRVIGNWKIIKFFDRIIDFFYRSIKEHCWKNKGAVSKVRFWPSLS